MSDQLKPYNEDWDVFIVTKVNGVVMEVTCKECSEKSMVRWERVRSPYELQGPSYGVPIFNPLAHKLQCPVRNHVWLADIGPSIDPRAMVFGVKI